MHISGRLTIGQGTLEAAVTGHGHAERVQHRTASQRAEPRWRSWRVLERRSEEDDRLGGCEPDAVAVRQHVGACLDSRLRDWWQEGLLGALVEQDRLEGAKHRGGERFKKGNCFTKAQRFFC